MDQSGLIFPKTQKKKKKRMKHLKSLLHEKNGTCYLCMLLDGNYKKHLFIDEHHIFGGPNRKHSEETGMKVWLCLDHHTMGPLAVHNCPETMRLLHRIGQQEYERTVEDDDECADHKPDWRESMMRNFLRGHQYG